MTWSVDLHFMYVKPRRLVYYLKIYNNQCWSFFKQERNAQRSEAAKRGQAFVKLEWTRGRDGERESQREGNRGPLEG